MIPELTDEQRAEALKKAMQARTARKEFRLMLKAGGMEVGEALEQPVAKRMKIMAFLMSFPKVGRNKALDIINAVGISQERRVSGLTERQKRGVVEQVLAIQAKPGAKAKKEA